MLKYINLTDSESIKFKRDVPLLNAVHDSNIYFSVIDLYIGQIGQSLPTTSTSYMIY